MFLYILYRIGYFLVMTLPLPAAYAVAVFLGDVCYLASYKDRASVISNMRTISGSSDEKTLRRNARELYRNFAKYLVDFFRVSKLNKDYLGNFIKVEGEEHLKKALARGKGVIILSAHLGNWELGGFTVGLLGYPLSAVVLTHRNEKINNFFRKRRLSGSMRPIEIGASLKECYKVLKANKLLALLGDRDFTKNGIMLDFFGKKTLFPKGPSVLSYRLDAAIVPSFMVRQKDDTFKLTFEEAMCMDKNKSEDEAVREMTEKYARLIKNKVKEFPTQWFIFKDMWNKDE